jgi:hypothetical protein
MTTSASPEIVKPPQPLNKYVAALIFGALVTLLVNGIAVAAHLYHTGHFPPRRELLFRVLTYAMAGSIGNLFMQAAQRRKMREPGAHWLPHQPRGPVERVIQNVAFFSFMAALLYFLWRVSDGFYVH